LSVSQQESLLKQLDRHFDVTSQEVTQIDKLQTYRHLSKFFLDTFFAVQTSSIMYPLALE